MGSLSRSMLHASLLAGLVAALLPAPAQADPIVNGGFEAGTNAGWQVGYRFTGDGDPNLPRAYVAVVGTPSGFPPLAGSASALLATVSHFPTGVIGATSCANDRFNPNFCPPYPPTGVASAAAGGTNVTHALPTGIPSATHGMGYLAQDFTGGAGDVIEWNWLRDARADGADYMFAALTNGSHFFTYASRGQDAYLLEGLMLANGTTQWLQQSFGLMAIQNGELRHQGFTLPAEGLWSLYFGVSHGADSWFSAAIQLDDVQVRGVPEPGTFALCVLGLMLLTACRSRDGVAARKADVRAASAAPDALVEIGV